MNLSRASRVAAEIRAWAQGKKTLVTDQPLAITPIPPVDEQIIKWIVDDVISYIHATRNNEAYEAYVVMMAEKDGDIKLARGSEHLIRHLEARGYIPILDIDELACNIEENIRRSVIWGVGAQIAVMRAEK